MQLAFSFPSWGHQSVTHPTWARRDPVHELREERSWRNNKVRENTSDKRERLFISQKVGFREYISPWDALKMCSFWTAHCVFLWSELWTLRLQILLWLWDVLKKKTKASLHSGYFTLDAELKLALFVKTSEDPARFCSVVFPRQGSASYPWKRKLKFV